MARRELRRLAGLGLQLRRLRRQRHGSGPGSRRQDNNREKGRSQGEITVDERERVVRRAMGFTLRERIGGRAGGDRRRWRRKLLGSLLFLCFSPLVRGLAVSICCGLSALGRNLRTLVKMGLFQPTWAFIGQDVLGDDVILPLHVPHHWHRSRSRKRARRPVVAFLTSQREQATWRA
jgi:hypothetical protein